MSTDRNVEDLERRLARSLHAAAPRPAPDLADRLLRRTALIEQRRGFLGLGFFPALAAAAVVVVAVAIGVAIGNVLPRGANVGPSTIPTTPEPSATAPATPTIEPSAPTPGFEGGQRCTNPELGYSVDYPADWWANEAQEFDDPVLTDIAPCFAFAEAPVELLPNAGLPQGVAIVFSRADRVLPPSTGATVVDSDETTVAGRSALVREDEEGESGAPFSFPGQLRYTYFIELASGDYLVVGTSSRELNDADYEAHKAILDLMMETLQLSDGQAG